jgi:hypothetical protein
MFDFSRVDASGRSNSQTCVTILFTATDSSSSADGPASFRNRLDDAFQPVQFAVDDGQPRRELSRGDCGESVQSNPPPAVENGHPSELSGLRISWARRLQQSREQVAFLRRRQLRRVLTERFG